MIKEKTEKTREEHDVNWHVLVWGLPRPIEPLTLAPGITLRPLTSPLSVFDLAAAGAVGFHSWAVIEPTARMCNCEIESAKDAVTLPGYDTLNRAWLAASLLVLLGYTHQMCMACSTYSWNEIAGHQKRSKEKLPTFKGDLLDFHLKLQVNQNAKNEAVSPTDASWVNDHFPTFNKLASEDESFRFALEAAIDWRYSKDARAAVSRLWSGIEALFGIKSELVYRISLYCASLLVKRGDARINKFHQVKNLYDLRSKAVHGAPLSDEKMASAVDGSFDLLSGLLLTAISLGRVPTSNDLDQAVFSE